MRVLVACERFGAVREAFRARGHDAWSCDISPAKPGGRYSCYHLFGDVRPWLGGMLGYPWDLIIAFPPCTDLAVSGARYFAQKQEQQAASLDFVRELLNAPAERVALENPVGVISTHVRKPDQIIQPWEFGHPESKKTCLWLRGLPLLMPTNVLPLPPSGRWSNQTPSGQNKLGPSPTRAAERGRTYRGIAEAMAAQWGGNG